MSMNKCMYDNRHVRYRIVKSNPGNILFNWLFIPGGPGADSMYFLDLVNQLNMPGNYWLIDFPANGSNISKTVPAEYNFEVWSTCLLSAVSGFDKPIIVGHSFGGMFPLMFPELENILTGFVILNSAPSLWLEEAAKYAKENGIPLLEEPMAEFEHKPNDETFKKALMACAPYYFIEKNLEKGKELLKNLPFNYHAAVWWLKKVNEINFKAEWIPEKVKTLVIGASHDFITPFSLFEKDVRFQRDNITFKKIENAGHFPWLEHGQIVAESFSSFANNLLNEQKG